MGRCVACGRRAPDVPPDARYLGCTRCGALQVYGSDEFVRTYGTRPPGAGTESHEDRANRLEKENRVLREIAEDSLEIVQWLADNQIPGYRAELRAKIRKALGTEGAAA